MRLLPPPPCPSSQALRTAAVFSYWTVAYAQDEAAFVRDFQRVVQRMHQVGAALVGAGRDCCVLLGRLRCTSSA